MLQDFLGLPLAHASLTRGLLMVADLTKLNFELTEGSNYWLYKANR